MSPPLEMLYASDDECDMRDYHPESDDIVRQHFQENIYGTKESVDQA